MNLAKIGKTTLRKGAQQVQRRCRLFIHTQQTLWIRNAVLGSEIHRVDHITAIAWQLHTINGFSI